MCLLFALPITKNSENWIFISVQELFGAECINQLFCIIFTDWHGIMAMKTRLIAARPHRDRDREKSYLIVEGILLLLFNCFVKHILVDTILSFIRLKSMTGYRRTSHLMPIMFYTAQWQSLIKMVRSWLRTNLFRDFFIPGEGEVLSQILYVDVPSGLRKISVRYIYKKHTLGTLQYTIFCRKTPNLGKLGVVVVGFLFVCLFFVRFVFVLFCFVCLFFAIFMNH